MSEETSYVVALLDKFMLDASVWCDADKAGLIPTYQRLRTEIEEQERNTTALRTRAEKAEATLKNQIKVASHWTSESHSYKLELMRWKRLIEIAHEAIPAPVAK